MPSQELIFLYEQSYLTSQCSKLNPKQNRSYHQSYHVVFNLISRSFWVAVGSTGQLLARLLHDLHPHPTPGRSGAPPTVNVCRGLSYKQGLQGVPGAFHTTIRDLFWIKAGFRRHRLTVHTCMYIPVLHSSAHACLNEVNSS